LEAAVNESDPEAAAELYQRYDECVAQMTNDPVEDPCAVILDVAAEQTDPEVVAELLAAYALCASAVSGGEQGGHPPGE
jgi:hypothetical protein